MYRQLTAMKTLLPAFFALLLTSGGAAERAAEEANKTAAPERKTAESGDALFKLNEASRAAYRRAKEEALARIGPIVLVERDELVFVYGLERTRARITPEAYRILKTISHVPLAVFAHLDRRDGHQLADERLYDLKRYRAQVAIAAESLKGCGLSEPQLERLRKIIEESLRFLGRVVEDGSVKGKELEAFTRGLRPLLDANSTEAARAQIDALHRQMKLWKGRLTEAEWKRLHVIVIGPQLPRKDNLAVQYFAHLLREAGEGERVVYAEGLFEESRALDLLATRTVDTDIGSAFFADTTRMHRDLLGDAARDYLAELFPRRQP